jgi:TPR repeat protein
MSFYKKQCLFLIVASFFISLGYASQSEETSTSLDSQETIRMAREKINEERYEEAFEDLKSVTEHAEAQFLLGIISMSHDYNIKKAKYWFEKAVNQGYTNAQYILSVTYLYNGEIEKGIFSLEKLAEQKNVEALRELAVMYFFGKYVTEDRSKSFSYLKEAALQDDAQSQFELGVMYFKGEGTNKNDKLARVWLKKAANQNNSSAQRSLGIIYRDGNGVRKNAEKAIYWLRRAASNGDEGANALLHEMYERGELPRISGFAIEPK